MTEPNISVVIPTYNNGAYLTEAINSVRSQAIEVGEIIVIDDGSTDATREVMQKQADDVHYIRQSNAGPSAARNRGIKIATGDWIAFLDADDSWTPNKISRQLAILKRHPTLALIASDMREIDCNGETLTPSVLAKHGLLETFQALNGAPVPNAMSALLKKNFIPTGTVLVKHSVLTEVGGFREEIRFGEDLELWSRIAAHHPITCVPEVHMFRRLHGANATQETANMLADMIKVMSSLREREPEQLRHQETDPDRLVADAWWQLGYWYFANDRLSEAEKTFRISLREKYSPRTLIYYLASMLPPALLEQIRRVKRYVHANKALEKNPE